MRPLDTDRFDDLVHRGDKTQMPVFTDFLEISKWKPLLAYSRKYSNVITTSFCGFKDDERRMIGIFPKDIYDGFQDDVLQSIFPVKIMGIQPLESGSKQINHRDVLGAILGLGTKRSLVGDLLHRNGVFYCVLHERLEMILLQELAMVGNQSVDRFLVEDHNEVKDLEPVVEPLRISVASPRLDSVVKGLIGEKREKCQTMVRSGLVKVNQIQIGKADFQIHEDDVLSIRGYGKYRVLEFGGISKKGRQQIQINKYI